MRGKEEFLEDQRVMLNFVVEDSWIDNRAESFSPSIVDWDNKYLSSRVRTQMYQLDLVTICNLVIF